MINLLTILKIAIRALIANKVRSGLTTLGIIIGISAVIIMIAVGEGATQKVTSSFSSLGSNLLLVHSGTAFKKGMRSAIGSQPTLKMKDVKAILKNNTAIKTAAPLVSGTSQIIYKNQNWFTSIKGTTPEFFVMQDWDVLLGSNLTHKDVTRELKICIMGQTVASNLFGDLDPIGKSVRIKGIPFKVTGLLKKKGQSMMGIDMDDVIYVPITVAQKRLFGTEFPGMIHIIMAQAIDKKHIKAAENELTLALRQSHKISYGKEDDFTVKNLAQILEIAESSTKVFSLLLGAIASISLLVGGIGIMNIMLVSVTERTKEIGIRLAIGAKPRDIRLQFLVEALILSLMGGFIGITIGVTLSCLIAHLIKFPVIISVPSILLAFAVSGFTGIFFGFYPAYKASKLNPIDALRYE